MISPARIVNRIFYIAAGGMVACAFINILAGEDILGVLFAMGGVVIVTYVMVTEIARDVRHILEIAYADHTPTAGDLDPLAAIDLVGTPGDPVVIAMKEPPTAGDVVDEKCPYSGSDTIHPIECPESPTVGEHYDPEGAAMGIYNPELDPENMKNLRGPPTVGDDSHDLNVATVEQHHEVFGEDDHPYDDEVAAAEREIRELEWTDPTEEPCPKCGEDAVWGHHDNEHDPTDWYECKSCHHAWPEDEYELEGKAKPLTQEQVERQIIADEERELEVFGPDDPEDVDA